MVALYFKSTCSFFFLKRSKKKRRMENREDLRSILPYLPVVMRSSTLFWPSQVVEALKELARGPIHSHVDSGHILFTAITDMRNSLSLSSQPLAPSASLGYALFFDEVIQHRYTSPNWASHFNKSSIFNFELWVLRVRIFGYMGVAFYI